MRGTPQQIIDKYNQLARDSQLSGDRVATENFQQHSEHYTRMLAQPLREQEARREAQEAQHRERQQQHQQTQQQRSDRDDRGSGDQPQSEAQPRPQPQPEPQPEPAAQPAQTERASDVIDMQGDGDTGLVETPESKPAPKPRTRRPRKPASSADGGESGPAEAAE